MRPGIDDGRVAQNHRVVAALAVEGAVRGMAVRLAQRAHRRVRRVYVIGPTTVARYGGIPPYPETQNYVKKVKRYMNDYQAGKDVIL